MASIPAEKWRPHAVCFWLNLLIISTSVVVALGCWGPALPAATALTAPERTVDQRDAVTPMTTAISAPAMTISVALNNGKPTLILFYPVELCQIRYCLQPSLVMERLAQWYPDQINFVEAPVYANNTPHRPRFPIVDLGVYLVEPYAHWVPEVEQTPFGWGINAPSVVLIEQNGVVLYRGGEFFAIEELHNYVE